MPCHLRQVSALRQSLTETCLIDLLTTAEIRRGNWDPLCWQDEIVLTWQFSVPSFASDTDVYIREQHKQLPENQYAYLHLEEDDHITTSRLIIVFGTADCLKKLSKFRSNKEIYSPPSVVQNSQIWSADSEIISTCAVFRVLISDTTSFSHALIGEIQGMVSNTI